jgi:hypothetical protein
MFENEMQTRAASCGTGILPGLVLVLAHLPSSFSSSRSSSSSSTS